MPKLLRTAGKGFPLHPLLSAFPQTASEFPELSAFPDSRGKTGNPAHTRTDPSPELRATGLSEQFRADERPSLLFVLYKIRQRVVDDVQLVDFRRQLLLDSSQPVVIGALCQLPLHRLAVVLQPPVFRLQ